MSAEGEYEGKVAIVTGSGGGLGRAIAAGLAKGGAKVLLVDLKAEGLQETASAITDAGGTAQTLSADLSKRETPDAIIKAAIDHFGQLDILVNNAGIIYFRTIDNIDPDEWERCFAVNVHAPAYLMKAAMPHLLETNGCVVNIASNAAFKGQAYTADYCGSKAALMNVSKSFAVEQIHKPVRINCVAPGGINTPMASGASFGEGMDMTLMQRYFPLRGMSEPEDIAEVALFLASDRARSVHGATYIVDKGMNAG